MGEKKNTSMSGATEREECIPLKPGWLLLRKLALSLVLKRRRAESAALIPLEAANTKASRLCRLQTRHVSRRQTSLHSYITAHAGLHF